MPLVMLHGTSCTAECFFNQVSSLGARGYRVISAQFPVCSLYDTKPNVDLFINKYALCLYSDSLMTMNTIAILDNRRICGWIPSILGATQIKEGNILLTYFEIA
jgi:hypothetical protein